jgi:PAS domain-containing protein
MEASLRSDRSIGPEICFFEPLHTWVVHPHEPWAFGAFGLAALAILGAIESMRRAKAKLAESRDLLATTFSSIGDGVIVIDDPGRVTSMNLVAERLTGWKSAEAVGQPLPQSFAS